MNEVANQQLNIVAGNLYSTYCAAVGGVAFDGKPLPPWEEFSHDPNKQKQADGWREVAKAAAAAVFDPAFGPKGYLVTLKDEVFHDKALRKELDLLIQIVKSLPASRERALTITKLQEGVMWLGMDLKRIGETSPELVKNPYPNSKNPGNPNIEATADGLKL